MESETVCSPTNWFEASDVILKTVMPSCTSVQRCINTIQGGVDVVPVINTVVALCWIVWQLTQQSDALRIYVACGHCTQLAVWRRHQEDMDPRSLSQMGWPSFCPSVPCQTGDLSVPPTVSPLVSVMSSPYTTIQPFLPGAGNFHCHVIRCSCKLCLLFGVFDSHRTSHRRSNRVIAVLVLK